MQTAVASPCPWLFFCTKNSAKNRTQRPRYERKPPSLLKSLFAWSMPMTSMSSPQIEYLPIELIARTDCSTSTSSYCLFVGFFSKTSVPRCNSPWYICSSYDNLYLPQVLDIIENVIQVKSSSYRLLSLSQLKTASSDNFLYKKMG